MNRSISLLSALALSSAALLSVQPQEANAMSIAYDCFERSTEKLVARGSVDMTSILISCLPVPGSTITADNSAGLEEDAPADDELISEGNGEQFPDDGGMDSIDNEEIGEETTSEKIADLLGHLIGKGINDLTR